MMKNDGKRLAKTKSTGKTKQISLSKRMTRSQRAYAKALNTQEMTRRRLTTSSQVSEHVAEVQTLSTKLRTFKAILPRRTFSAVAVIAISAAIIALIAVLIFIT